MNNEVIGFQVNNSICEAVGCFEKATSKINVKVGQLGTIPLDLCIECIQKFDQNTPGKQISNKRSSEMKRPREVIEE